jgi:DNA polymerase bacteriophage-type
MSPEYLLTALHISCQTRSQLDLQRAGPSKYAEHASTDVEYVAYAIGAGPVSVWCRGDEAPVGIVAHLAANLPIVAYDAAFERAIWCRILVSRYGWPQPRLEQFHCSSAMAATLVDGT